MASRFSRIPLVCILAASAAVAQEGDGGGNGAPEEAPIVEEPPFEPGDRIKREGEYFDRKNGQGEVNFRIVEKNIRVYFLDEGGRVIEPPYPEGNVRFRNERRNTSYVYLQPLTEDTGMGSPRLIRKPHIFSASMSFFDSDDEDAGSENYSFRYSALQQDAEGDGAGGDG